MAVKLNNVKNIKIQIPEIRTEFEVILDQAPFWSSSGFSPWAYFVCLGPILSVLYTQPLSQVLQTHHMDHKLFADDSQLHRSCQPTDVDQTISSVQDCVSDIKDWMTDNKLQRRQD